VKVDQNLPMNSADPAGDAQRARADGYDGAWAAETMHDPMITIARAAAAVPGMDLGTAIAIAFARTPMNMAVAANDLQLATGGHFFLGLGSQVRGHITRRFSMPWSHPAPRMREFILAMRAIWAAWNGDGSLNFEGEFYTHTLMTPFFNPGPNPYGPPPVLLAGVGVHMTEVAGEVADGLLCHAFTTEKYIREVTVPAIERGAARGGRAVDDITLTGGPFVVTGRTEEEHAAADAAVRAQIAFYASTPAYRPVLELHGWGEVQNELNAMTKAGAWADMGGRITDEMLDAFAVVAEPDKVAAEVVRRYGDLWSRISIYAPYDGSEGLWEPIVTDLRAAPGRRPQSG
jgi:probable F420-dependent oxidoreductase